jgi:Penicillin-insensitive murein endopeptidase
MPVNRKPRVRFRTPGDAVQEDYGVAGANGLDVHAVNAIHRQMRIVVPALSLLIVAIVAAVALAQDPAPEPTTTPVATATTTPAPSVTPAVTLDTSASPDLSEVIWHHSKALGKPAYHGRLVDGVKLPELGEDFFSWDPIYNRIPDREWRRYGTDRLIRMLLTVIHAYRTADDSAPRVGIMDLSRTHGGAFGRNFGGLGHASHQNGLDADVMYPRRDGQESRATKPSDVDQKRAQELLDLFVQAGAVKVFVGPHLKHLHGPKNVVVPLIYHDDHMHVRIR